MHANSNKPVKASFGVNVLRRQVLCKAAHSHANRCKHRDWPFHGGNTGANPVGDAEPFHNLSWPACARGHPRLLPNRISIGKIVLLCKPRSPLRDKSFFLARFVVGLIFVLAIRWMRILRTGELY